MPCNCTDSQTASSQLIDANKYETQEKEADIRQKRPFVVKFSSQKNAV